MFNLRVILKQKQMTGEYILGQHISTEPQADHKQLPWRMTVDCPSYDQSLRNG